MILLTNPTRLFRLVDLRHDFGVLWTSVCLPCDRSCTRHPVPSTPTLSCDPRRLTRRRKSPASSPSRPGRW